MIVQVLEEPSDLFSDVMEVWNGVCDVVTRSGVSGVLIINSSCISREKIWRYDEQTQKKKKN